VTDRTILIVGGSAGIGLELAKDLIAGGDRVIVTSRSQETADAVVAELGERASGVTLDLSEPEEIAGRLAGVGHLDGLVLSAIERDANTIREYDIARARRLITLKLIGYTETIHTLLDRLTPTVDTGIVLFGGRAKDAPYPGSTTVSTINGGVEGIMNTLALELAPIRVNALHPGIIGNSPFWSNKPDGVLSGYESRTPGGQLATMADIVDATKFLLFNRGVSAHSLNVDRGWRIT
jgi:NAD(P)-dependent dehydrogenase (short-subunit alcohol dehydrogenase family)